MTTVPGTRPETDPAGVVIVGGGVSGLTAAWRARAAWPDAQIRVFEAADRLGGCLKADTLDGYAPEGADVGAEASLYVRPETRELAAELGLEPVYPDRAQSSQLYVHGAMHRMPAHTLMGVPGDPDALSDILAPADVERVRAETTTDPVAGDVAVGEFLAQRLGDAVVDELIDPLIGGVYSGRCRELSMAATVPALLPAARTGAPVLRAVQDALAKRSATHGANIPGTQEATAPPVFMSLRGGINRLASALAERLAASGVQVHTASPVTHIAATAGGWTVEAGGRPVHAERLVLAVPAYAAARLLKSAGGPAGGSAAGAPRAAGGAAARIAGILERIPYADSALVNTVLRLDGPTLTGSGFLVPPAEPAFIKASTYASNKWPWLAETLPAGHALVRMSIGRHGDDPGAWSQLDDAELARRAIADWMRITGRHDTVVTAGVQRWTQVLPQYLPGHLDGTEAIDGLLPALPGLGLVGSAFAGVGIPVCIARAGAEIARLAGPPTRPYDAQPNTHHRNTRR